MAKAPWYALSDAQARRPADTRDLEEHRAVAAALEILPVDHAARRAHAEGAGTIALSPSSPIAPRSSRR